MNSLMRILQFVLPYKRRLIRAVILTGALTLVSMVPPLLLRYLADDIVTAGRWDMLGRVIAAMIAVPVLMAAIRLAALSADLGCRLVQWCALPARCPVIAWEPGPLVVPAVYLVAALVLVGWSRGAEEEP